MHTEYTISILSMLCVDGKSIFNHKAIDFHKRLFHILLICILSSPLLQDSLSITCSLPCLGSLVCSSYQRTEIAAVLAVSILFFHREYSLFSNEHFQMQMTLQIRAVLLLRATTKPPPAYVPIQSWSTQPHMHLLQCFI